MSGGAYYTNPLQGEDYSYSVVDSSHVGFYDSASGASSIGSPEIPQVRAPFKTTLLRAC